MMNRDAQHRRGVMYFTRLGGFRVQYHDVYADVQLDFAEDKLDAHAALQRYINLMGKRDEQVLLHSNM